MRNGGGFPVIFKGFLEKSVDLGQRIRRDSMKARVLIQKLEGSTNFRAILEQEAQNKERFLNEAKSFSQAILQWTEDYPKVLDEFGKVLSITLNDLSHIGFVVVRDFPSFSITFNERKFEFILKEAEDGQTAILTPPQAQIADLARQENKLVNEIAEIVSLEYHILKFMKNIQESIDRNNVGTHCKYIAAQNEINFIDQLHIVVSWWMGLQTILKRLKKVTFTAIELDRDAANRLKKMARGAGKIRMEQDQINVVVGALKLLGKLSLDLIPGGNIISTAMEVYESRGLYRQALGAFKQ